MSAVLAGKVGWALMVTAWYIMRFPYERRSKRASVGTNQKRGAEIARMTVAGIGLGVLPMIYLWTPLLSFADRASGWLAVLLASLTGCGVIFLISSM